MVKSRGREEHFHVLKRVFERCRTFKLRMNPLKCAFGVSSRKFLGFLVHSRGIDVDPAKATAITTTRSPTTVKDSSLGWHQSPLLSPNFSEMGKTLSGEKHNRQSSKGYSRS